MRSCTEMQADTNNARLAPRSCSPRRLGSRAYSPPRSRRLTNPGYDQQVLEGARAPIMDTVDPTSCAIRPNWMMLQREDGGRIDECPAPNTATRGNATCALGRRRCAEPQQHAAKPITTRLHTPVWVYSLLQKTFLARCGGCCPRAARLRAFSRINAARQPERASMRGSHRSPPMRGRLLRIARRRTTSRAPGRSLRQPTGLGPRCPR